MRLSPGEVSIAQVSNWSRSGAVWFLRSNDDTLASFRREGDDESFESESLGCSDHQRRQSGEPANHSRQTMSEESVTRLALDSGPGSKILPTEGL